MATEGGRLVVRDARTGTVTQSVNVGAGMTVSTIDAAGRWVALTSVPSTPYLPAGRTRTEITVVHVPDSSVQRFDLSGNLAPDAFATDGGGLFVVSYLPPEKPDRYQITSLNMATGEVAGIFGRQKEALEDMRGVAGMRKLAPDGATLYTLYLRPPDGATSDAADTRAEIHTLKLDQFWAHCVDLPAGFGGGNLSAAALAVSPDGTHVYAVDRAQHQLVEVDTNTLMITRTVDVALAQAGEPTSMVVTDDGHLYLSDGPSILVINTDTLAVAARWTTPGPVTGLVAARNGQSLVASSPQQVATFAPSGNRQATTAVPSDATAISRIVT
jgi:DNA-binding beta-propeller fold protein YncE